MRNKVIWLFVFLFVPTVADATGLSRGVSRLPLPPRAKL
jgi:hypothetical protein